MIGHEGMLGATLALGIQRHPMPAIVQGAGPALEISVSGFQVQVLSRRGLEAVTCECYAADLTAYRRQFGDA